MRLCTLSVVIAAGLTALLGASAAAAATVMDRTGGPPPRAHYMSLWQASCDVGVIELSDRKRSPDRMARLSAALAPVDAGSVASPTLVVSRYAVFLNGRLAEQGGAGRASGLIGGILSSGMARKTCDASNSKGGWYTAQAGDPPVSPIVTEIEADFADRHYSIRSVHFPPFELFPVDILRRPVLGRDEDMELSGSVSGPIVAEALDKANAELVADIERDLPAKSN
jgi:hypothetical protein